MQDFPTKPWQLLYMEDFLSAPERFQALFQTTRAILTVISIGKENRGKFLEIAIKETQEALSSGAHGIVYRNDDCNFADFRNIVKSLKEHFPDLPLGVNYTGDDWERYGFLKSFQLASENDLAFVWTWFSGIDRIDEREAIDVQRIWQAQPKEIFYFSGIHMSQSTLQHPEKSIECSTLQAIGYVDGIVTTLPTEDEPENKLERFEEIAKSYPYGIYLEKSQEPPPNFKGSFVIQEFS